MANQFTQAAEQGLEPPKAVNQFTRRGSRQTEHESVTKDRIRAELVAKRLHKFAMAKGKNVKKHWMEGPQVAAAKVIVDKGKPSLQAVEQFQADPLQDLSEDGIIEMAKALILQHPEVIRALNLIPDPAVVQQQVDTGLVSTIMETIESTGTSK